MTTGLLLRGARLVPLRPGEEVPDRPVDVLVEGDEVTAVGPALQRPAGVEEYGVDGRWIMPGLWDAHAHLGQWTLARQRLDTGAVTSADEAVALVAAKVAEAPGRPVVGWGHRPGGWARLGTVAELDAVSGVTPVVLVAGDGHHAWLNTAAQAALELPLRENVVREDEWFAAYGRLAHLSASGDGPADYRESLDRAAALGVVGIVDLEFAGGIPGWRERWHEGCDLLRIRAAVYPEGLDEALGEGLRTGDALLPGVDLLRAGPLKIISDGSLNTRTAWCCQPYAVGGDPVAPSGAPNLSADDLLAHLGRAHEHGWEVATHAIGDAAVARALDSYERTGARGSIEHVQLLADGDEERLARLGLRASVQPHHLVDDRDLTEAIWPGRSDRCFAFRRLLDAGATLTLGSDAPVSPLDPWLAVDAAVRRTGDARPAWHPEQALTRREALAASVDGQPAVGAGSRGDLVVLDHDPLEVPRPDVELTVVAGRIVHGGPVS
ncbi:amidohydrolase [Nocardioides panacisoli]|uniref:Amidohydrolase family protein n=1 Tax=Nocardioides panacisoli TaxID=627624 RepID=A0ABP7IZK4_9ACTN